MRCRQSRRQLKEAFDSGRRIDNDLLLMAHLRQCPECSRIAQPLLQFGGDLAIAGRDDLDGGLPLDRLRALVENRAPQPSPQPKEQSIMARFMHGISRRPRLGLGVAAVAAVVLLALVIPMKFQDNTLGYEVAFAGVDKAVAMDTDKIEALLAKLGVTGAEVNLGDCEETCKLKVTQLKSADEALLVYTAFNDFVKLDLHGDVLELRQGDEGQVYRIAIMAGDLEDCATIQRDSACSIILEALGPDSSLERLVCISIDSCDQPIVWCDSASLGGPKIQLFGGESMDLDDSTLQALEAQGFTVQRIEGDSGSQSLMILKVGDCGPTAAAVPYGDAAAKTDPTLPEAFSLDQNYPNPFNPSTTISFSLPSAGEARLEVYNVQGQLVKTLVEGHLDAGTHQVVWDGTDGTGAEVASGVYLYRLTAGDQVETRKMSLVK